MMSVLQCSKRCTIAALLLAVIQLGAAAESEKCQALGFTGPVCSDCDTLASYVKDDELVSECRQCCVKGKEATLQKYSHALLYVWTDRLSGWPHIEGFVKNEAQKFEPALEIRDRYGVAPRLVMSAPGVTKKSVLIDGWKTEHVVEYLHDMLEPREAQESEPTGDGLEEAAAGTQRTGRKREVFAE